MEKREPRQLPASVMKTMESKTVSELQQNSSQQSRPGQTSTTLSTAVSHSQKHGQQHTLGEAVHQTAQAFRTAGCPIRAPMRT